MEVEARFGMDTQLLTQLLEHVPHFHVALLGPWDGSKPGHPEQKRCRVEVDLIVAPSTEEAVMMAFQWAEGFCTAHGAPFIEETWTVETITRCNCN